jgi:predicted PurR-regulated permease PerM
MDFGTTMFAAFLLALGAMLLLWAIADAMNRRKSPLLVLIAVVLFFPFGLMAWLLFRPPVAGQLPELQRLQPRR